MFDLLSFDLRDRQNNIKMSILFRQDGIWQKNEVGRLVNVLKTEVSQHPSFSEYLIIFGHYTNEQILTALGDSVVSYTATNVIGIKNAPFNPGWTA